MIKIAFTFVLFYEVIAMLHNYFKGFPCTYVVVTKHQDCKANYLKVRNHSRHPARKCRFLKDRYVVFALTLLDLVIILGF